MKVVLWKKARGLIKDKGHERRASWRPRFAVISTLVVALSMSGLVPMTWTPTCDR